jgi:hypothetical protein
MNECTIYDFETLGQDQQKSVVLSFAILSFSESRYTSDNPYTYDELIGNCNYIKFNVKEQVEVFGRTISKETLAWWKEQGKDAQDSQLKPMSTDVSIKSFHTFLTDNINLKNHKKAFTRGNTFDPIFLDSVLANCGHTNPMHWRTIRDTRSYIEGMSYGSGLENDFIPSEDLQVKFVKHDPRHDIVMDVMRMQTIARHLNA